jgi:hypothetical protein
VRCKFSLKQCGGDNIRRYYRCVSIVFFIIVAVTASFQALPGLVRGIAKHEEASSTSKKTEYTIFIEIEDHTLYLLQDDKCIKKYGIASGKYDTPSPIGHWKITSKADWGEGFGGRWLGLNVPCGTLELEYMGGVSG